MFVTLALNREFAPNHQGHPVYIVSWLRIVQYSTQLKIDYRDCVSWPPRPEGAMKRDHAT